MAASMAQHLGNGHGIAFLLAFKDELPHEV
jgi:hypothetical protein